MMRGKVTAVDAKGVYVQTAEFGVLGPCQAVAVVSASTAWFCASPTSATRRRRTDRVGELSKRQVGWDVARSGPSPADHRVPGLNARRQQHC